MKSHIPSFATPFLWSEDVSQLDLERDKHLIIKQVLDNGSAQATDWLRATYSADDITAVIEGEPASAWGKKSLALWSLVYGVSPRKQRHLT